MPVIFGILVDEYVTMDFGTQVVEGNPAHDVNLTLIWELSMNYKRSDVFNDDGTMSAKRAYIKERIDLQEKICCRSKAAGFIEKIEDYKNNVGRSGRTNAVNGQGCRCGM